MLTHLSYHILDFKVEEIIHPQTAELTERIIGLELGDAFYGSNLRGRKETFDNHRAMLRHAAQHGRLHLDHPVYRNFKHSMANSERGLKNLPDYLNTIQSPEKCVHFITDVQQMETAGFECIQERQAQFRETNAPDVVFGGAIDSFFVCNNNKQVLNTLLTLQAHPHLQPETWFYEIDQEEPFSPPANIPFFIIKPSNESLGEGVLLVPNHELLSTLQALKNREPLASHLGNTDYYQHHPEVKLLIQRFYPGKTVSHDKKNYRPTGRAVFAVVRHKDEISVEILDIFWKLPSNAIQSDMPAARESISYCKPSSFNAQAQAVVGQISLSNEEYPAVKNALQDYLLALSQCLYGMDLHDYVQTLYEAKKFNEISYYLKHCSRTRVQRLDQAFIDIILEANKEAAHFFLVEQAKTYALAWHLNHKNTFLAKWLQDNLKQLGPDLLADLKQFLTTSAGSMQEAPILNKQEIAEHYQCLLSTIHSLEENKQATKSTLYHSESSAVLPNKDLEESESREYSFPS